MSAVCIIELLISCCLYLLEGFVTYYLVLIKYGGYLYF